MIYVYLVIFCKYWNCVETSQYSFLHIFSENATFFPELLIPNNIIYYTWYPSIQSHLMVLSTSIGVMVHPKSASLAFYKNIALRLNIATLNTEELQQQMSLGWTCLKVRKHFMFSHQNRTSSRGSFSNLLETLLIHFFSLFVILQIYATSS